MTQQFFGMAQRTTSSVPYRTFSVANSIKPSGVASRLLYGERVEKASRTGHAGAHAGLTHRSEPECRRYAHGGWTKPLRHASGVEGRHTALALRRPLLHLSRFGPGLPARQPSETVSRKPQLGSTHFFQQDCIFQPTEYDTHARFVIRDLF